MDAGVRGEKEFKDNSRVSGYLLRNTWEWTGLCGNIKTCFDYVWLERLVRHLNGNIGPEALMRALG